MKALIIESTELTPHIQFDPEQDLFEISGNSRPEDVRDFYGPVLEWLRVFLKEDIETGKRTYDTDHPFILKTNLSYFNSSSAKYLFDVMNFLNLLHINGSKVRIDWYFLAEDDDLRDAGSELSDMLEMPFNFIEISEE
jgi:hypothetical protein